MTRCADIGALVAWTLGFCLVAAGCTSGGNTPAGGATREARPGVARDPSIAPGQEAGIVFQSEPDPPRAGDNVLEVTVKGRDGSPLTDATVTAVFSMPAMPSMNMPPMRSTATLVHDTAGRYRGTGQLSMAGTWNVIVTVSRGADELGRKTFSIVAN